MKQRKEKDVSDDLDFDGTRDGSERRLFPRRPLDEEFYCYLPNGERFDAISLDISAGGIFLATKDDIAVETAITLVFKERPGVSQPVYLFGRVVRLKATEPNLGIGIEWERAVTAGAQEELASFLDDVLLIGNANVQLMENLETGLRQSFYAFPRYAVSSGDELAEYEEMEDDDTEEIHPASTSRRERLKAGSTATGRAAGRSFSPPPGEAAGAGFTRSPEDGALTMQLSAGHLAMPTNLPAVALFGGEESPAKIAVLGQRAMSVDVFRAVRKSPENMRVKFELRVRGGMAGVECRCKVVAMGSSRTVGKTSFDLQVVGVDEGGSPGVLRSYIRWLSLRRMSGGR